jgi:hypothetical protein
LDKWKNIYFSATRHYLIAKLARGIVVQYLSYFTVELDGSVFQGDMDAFIFKLM